MMDSPVECMCHHGHQWQQQQQQQARKKNTVRLLKLNVVLLFLARLLFDDDDSGCDAYTHSPRLCSLECIHFCVYSIFKYANDKILGDFNERNRNTENFETERKEKRGRERVGEAGSEKML